MNDIRVTSGIILVQIQNCYFLAADKEARKVCGFIHQINEIGAFIWNQLKMGKNYQDIISLIYEEYEVPSSEEVAHDVESYLITLREHHYISWRDKK